MNNKRPGRFDRIRYPKNEREVELARLNEQKRAERVRRLLAEESDPSKCSTVTERS